MGTLGNVNLRSLTSVVQRWRHRRACNRIRAHLAGLGFPIDATDEEIEAGCLTLSFELRGAGYEISTAEAADALRNVTAEIRAAQ